MHTGSALGTGVAKLYFYVDGFPAWASPSSMSQPSRVYDAGDVRWVLPATSFFSVLGQDGNWQIRVSGYQLTA